MEIKTDALCLSHVSPAFLSRLVDSVVWEKHLEIQFYKCIVQ